MNKKIAVLVSLVVLASLLLSACAAGSSARGPADRCACRGSTDDCACCGRTDDCARGD